MSKNSLTGFSDFPQQDGSIWRVAQTEGGGQVVLTRTCMNTIRDKTEKIIHHTDGTSEITTIGKDFLGTLRELRRGDLPKQLLHSGGNGTVYQIGESDLVIKECFTSQSLLSGMERMDRILELVDRGGVPRWIQLPIHYGFASIPDGRGSTKQYLLMKKIDEGVTVEDVLNGARSERAERQIQKSGLSDMQEEVRDRYQQCEHILKELCTTNGFKFESVFTDFHEGNVLVEKIDPPVGGSHIMFNIIDQ